MIAPASRKIGKYEIRSKLGRGGMADVYLAHDANTGQTVALKLIEHSVDEDTRDAIEAERRGAILQARLAAVDPRVVRVYDSSDADGFFYVAMEYIDGQDLAELMRRGPLAVEFAADAAVAVAETLHNAHNLQAALEGKNFHGIVHGDIKPKNIRIDSRGEVRVLDFGIAKALSLSRRLTRNEFGSVPYASPERLDTGDVSAMSDLWSLAVMLYEMVTGLQPYHAESTERLERMIRSHVPPPPAPDPCPEPLRLILNKALSVYPADRYDTARAFADDLIAFSKGEPVAAALESEDDRDATRRTGRGPISIDDETRRTAPSGDAGETRRTSRPEHVAASIATAETPKSKPAAHVFSNFMKVVAVLAIGFFLYGSWSIASWMGLHGRGNELERQIKSEQLTDPDKVWVKWTELSGTDPSSFALRGSRQAVKQKLLDAANVIISRYRNDTQLVYEKDWERAQTLLAHTLAVDPDDDFVRGELRLVDGQIARINGVRHKDGALINAAIEKFTEAQRLMPKSADPELGLALTYVYGLKDIDKGYAALQEAERRGFHLGNRERAQLADGYRDRADRLFWDTRNVRGLPQEKDQIERSGDDYRHALSLYQSIVPYGTAQTQIVRVQTSLESVTTRLREIAAGQLH